MIGRLGQIVRGFSALAVLACIVAGVPLVLIRAVGWPGPTAWPTADQLRQFTDAGVAEATIVKILAVVVWIAWLQLTLAIAVELVALARRRAATTLPLLPGVQEFAARLVAAAALIATSSMPRVAVATPLAAVVTPTAAAALVEAAATAGPPADRDTKTPAPTRTVVTTARDSWWRLAEQHLGDGLRWREIRDLNVGRTVADGSVIAADTEHVEAGWRLLVPDTGATPNPGIDPSDDVATEWDVEPGDHFWSIAEQTLTEAWDRAPADEEVLPYWQELIEANRDRLLPPGDPDVIYPDQRLVAPAPPANPDTEDPVLRPQAPPKTAAVSGEEPSAAPEHEGRVEEDADAAANQRLHSARDGWSTAIRGDRTEDTVGAPSADADDNDENPITAFGVPAGLAAGVAASGLLAAGVVATLRWRRRAALRHRAAGLRLPTPLREVADEISRLESAAVPEQVLDDLASLLASVPADVHPALVTATDDGAVTLLFEEHHELPDPPNPWVLADDGADAPVGWRAQLGDRGRERSIGLPLLVTLGRTGNTTVFANLGAMRTLTLGGPPDEVRRRLRAMALEAATSRIAVPLEVAISGDDALSTLGRVRHVDSLATEIDAALAELQHDVVADDRTPRLLVCHHDSQHPEFPDALTGTVGLIAVEERPTASWRLGVDDAHTGHLRLPDGGTVELDLPEIAPQLVDDELATLDAVPSAEPGTDNSHTVAPGPTGNGHLTAARETTRPAWCEVRLLGPIEVIRDGAPIEGLTPRTLEVIAYLVTHRDGVSKERLDDAVWAGHAPRPGSQRVTAALTKLRNALGDGPDGEPLVPRRTGAERIRLSEHVGSDLDRAFAHLAVARDLPGELRIRELAAALDLVRGEPFEDLPVSWATDITQRAIAQLQDAALDIARTRREAGDFDAADRAIHQGLHLLDPADALYLERAELEKARGHPERVAQIWQQLRRRHAEDADEIAGYVSTSPPEIELAFQELMGV